MAFNLQTVVIVPGDDYYAVDDRNILATFSNAPDLTGAAVKLLVVSVRRDECVFSVSGSISSPSSSPLISFEIPATTSAKLLDNGVGYIYAIVATLADSHIVTLGSASLNVSGLDVEGFAGYAGGSPGFSGFSGASGSAGTSGYSGQPGSQGTSGYSGAAGANGSSGQSGYSGSSGKSGFSGYSGGTGLQGISGFSGISGYSGKSGYSGSSGPGANQALNTSSDVAFHSVSTAGNVFASDSIGGVNVYVNGGQIGRGGADPKPPMYMFDQSGGIGDVYASYLPSWDFGSWGVPSYAGITWDRANGGFRIGDGFVCELGLKRYNGGAAFLNTDSSSSNGWSGWGGSNVNAVVIDSSSITCFADQTNFTGNVNISGSLTYSSSDPELETFYPVTVLRAQQLLRDNTPEAKWGGISLYFNTDRNQFEVIDHKSGAIRAFVLSDVLETIETTSLYVPPNRQDEYGQVQM